MSEDKEYKYDFNSERITKLILDVQKGYEDAYNELLYIFQPLIGSIAHSYIHIGDYDDVMQSANIGLYKAITNFDLTKENAKFSTYAYNYIKGEILNSINTNDGGVTMSSNFRQFALKVKKVRTEYENQTGITPSSEKIKELMKDDTISIDEIELALQSILGKLSLDQDSSSSKDENKKLMNTIKDEDARPDKDDQLEILIHYACSSDLTERELKVFLAKTGLNETREKIKTKVLASELEVSESRVMQIYKCAQIKIKKHMVQDGYTNIKKR